MSQTTVVSRQLLILRWLGVDRAIGYLLLTRVVQVAAYVVLIALMSRYFTAEQQGYYYTFASLLSLQVFVELGLALVITNTSSHEWAFLQTDQSLRIIGDPHALSRLVSLGRSAFKWYGVAVFVFVPAVSLVGWSFFSRDSSSSVDWQDPWIVLVLLTGLVFLLLPFNAILEGCNQVARANRIKLEQAILESLAVCTGLILGAGLWCAVISVVVRLARNIHFVFFEYRIFFRPFWRSPTGSKVNWLTEIWPMQWRLGVSGLVAYFLFSIFNPVMFHYHGAEVAGQMGMTLQMITGLQIISMSWVTTKIPSFGALIARKQYADLDHLWRRVSVISMGMLCAGSLVLWSVIYYSKTSGVSFAHRVLDPLPTVLFLSAAIILQCMQCLVAYLRAHKKEPIMVASVTTCLATGFMVWWLGSRSGPTGAGAGYLLVITAVVGWYWAIWKRCRREWHAS